MVDPPTPGVEGCRDDNDLAVEMDSGDGEKATDAAADVLKDTHLHDNDAASDGSKVKVSSQPTNVNTKQQVYRQTMNIGYYNAWEIFAENVSARLLDVIVCWVCAAGWW